MAEALVEVGSGNVAERRIALLLLRGERRRIQPLGIAVVETERSGSVEHLLPDAQPLAKLVGRAHAIDQRRRDRLAGLDVARETPQDRGVPAPFLQHLRRRLHEVPFGPHAGDPLPAGVAAEQMVQQVSELVEERHHFAMVEQRGLARGAGEIADQRRLGKRPLAHARGKRKLRRVLVLPLAREQVEVKATDRGPALHNFPGGDVVVPDGSIRQAPVLDAEHARGGVEHAVHHAAELEKGTHGLRVEPELLGAHALLERFGIPSVDAFGGRIVAPLPRQERFVVLPGPGLRRRGDPLDEVVRRRGAADHLVFRHVRRPALVAEQPRHLVAAGEHPVEHLQVSRMRALAVHFPELLARGTAARIRHERDVVGVVGGDDACGVAPHVIGRQPFEVGRLHLDPPHVVADVALELLSDPHQLFVERAHARAGGSVAVDAGAPKIAQHAEQIPARSSVLS